MQAQGKEMNLKGIQIITFDNKTYPHPSRGQLGSAHGRLKKELHKSCRLHHSKNIFIEPKQIF